MAQSAIIDCSTGEVQFVEAPEPDIDAAWASIREERNRLLAACDWTQLPDAPVDTAAWAVYRQELRDVTLQPDPFNLVWPQPPADTQV